MVLSSKDFNPKFPEKVIEAGKAIGEDEATKSFRRCYQCGTCTGSCPSGRITAFRTRKLIRSAMLGLGDYIKSEDLWKCTTCYTCYERCPRNVKITDIIKAMRNVASQMGYMALAHRKTTLYVYLTGHAVPVNDQIKEVRKNIGLTEIPPTTHKYPEALEDVRGIMNDMGLCDKVGICPTTKKLEELKPIEWEDLSE
ncbi:CoB--CoM heterodisulfide reductase subunit C [Methanothermococcus okinawensis]|uniref:CoB/CoM heterodisulfide reductase, subunit C n=1 Tax=Methanothermococcus okinawensis (strain DSM 14208 / JCM 11175 / IH1) TaxID=647113 RepID=F8AMI9_METOI|nr:CoB--CoM heterodisulfide reductase subunit C [Methanothermococcus okinawensis]AEH06029.1 CoB/CoM heterodisulfide reductase, subunit C [Methanothermococcus okinawensis IH1]